jgi:hypothetical protein
VRKVPVKSYREWYACDNLIRDAVPWLERDGHPATGASWLAVLNPSQDETAHAILSFYFEHLTAEPKQHALDLPPSRMTLLELHTLPEVPRNEFFGLGVASDIPVIPQVTNFEFRPWDRQPDATISKVMYPGPLTETEWYFPDGWQGGGPGSQMLWYERETLTLLNPGETEAKVTLTFYSYGNAADVDLWVPPHRLKSIALYDIPGLRFRWVEERRTRMIDFSLRVASDVAIVPQKTRRAYVQREASVQGMWTSFGCPYQATAKREQPRAEWYYPGGYVQDIGNYPRNDPNMLGWDLFFTFNPDPARTVHCTATFCYETDPPQTLEFDVEPLRQRLHWLHHLEYRHLTGLNRPYAVRVESDGPLVPHFLRAEYESWDEHSPTAMFGVIPYEGPLTDEMEWYLAEGFWQDSEEHPWVEQEWLAIFNPGREDAAVTVSFFFDGDVREHGVEVAGERVTVLRMEELDIVPSGAHYGVKVAATRPVVVQQTRRTFEKGAAPSTVSTTATLAVPYRGGRGPIRLAEQRQ